MQKAAKKIKTCGKDKGDGKLQDLNALKAPSEQCYLTYQHQNIEQKGQLPQGKVSKQSADIGS